MQAFIQGLLSTAVFPQRFSFFTVCLVNYLREVLPWLAPKRKFLKFRSPDCWKMHFRHSFWLQKHSLFIVCLQRQQFFLGSFMRLTFITPFKIEFLLPFTGCRKVLGKMTATKYLMNYTLFYKQRFFPTSVLLSFFMNSTSDVA